MGQEVVTLDGEIVDVDFSGSAALISAEIDRQIATAKKFPRDLNLVIKRIQQMATISEEAAAEMTYSLPKKDKNNKEILIDGPSIRFAEIVAQCYGNFRAEAAIMETNTRDGYIVARGMFMDLETNGGWAKQTRRNIKTKSGHIYGADMIQQTGNAASSIVLRNAILAGVPKPLWVKAWEMSKELLRGNEQERMGRVQKMIKAFASAHAVDRLRIMQRLGVQQEADITLDMLAEMLKIYSTLKNGEGKVADFFPTGEPEHEVVQSPLDDSDTKDTPSQGAIEAPAAAGKKKGGKGKPPSPDASLDADAAALGAATGKEPGDEADDEDFDGEMVDENGNKIT